MKYTYEEYQKTFYPEQWQRIQKPRTQVEWEAWVVKAMEKRLEELKNKIHDLVTVPGE